MRKVKKVVVVPLLRNGRPLSDSKQKDEDRYLQLLHMYTHFVLISVYKHLVFMSVCLFYVLERMYVRIYERSYDLSLLKPNIFIVHVCMYVCMYVCMFEIR